MRSTLISLLERAIAHYLALDPETLKRLSALSGKIIKIELTDWQTVLYLLPSAAGIAIQSHYAKKHDAGIKGTLFELVRLRLSDEKTSAALAKKLEIEGDIHLAQMFNHILQQIEIDWEELISAFTGDIVAHRIGSFARGLKRWSLQTKKSLGSNLTEYLQEESAHLPTREEVEDFFADVAELQHDLARLEARLK
jgi:ubiquinone biosynthesis protein UbiJ